MANIAKATTYAALLVPAASRYGLAPALLAGLVDHETGGTWNPASYRFEQFNPDTSADDDASRGLGQLLLSTARSLGYKGDGPGLFDPATNLDLAAKYLAQRIARAGSVQGGLSAYNGGYRPAAGFGAPYVGNPYTVVLARDRNGVPSSTRLVRSGEYANQPYVDSVMTRARSFATLPALGGASSSSSAPPPAPLTAVLDPLPRTTPAVPSWLLWLGAVAAVAGGIYKALRHTP